MDLFFFLKKKKNRKDGGEDTLTTKALVSAQLAPGSAAMALGFVYVPSAGWYWLATLAPLQKTALAKTSRACFSPTPNVQCRDLCNLSSVTTVTFPDTHQRFGLFP